MIKIALHGDIGSGKTTIANYLCEVYDVEIFSFADELKSNLASIGVKDARLYHRKDENSRKLMQVYGQVMRDQDPLYWVKWVLSGVELCEDLDEEAVVIDDLRYYNEARKLQQAGFTLVQVNKAGAVRTNFDDSEIDLDDWQEWDYELTAKDGDLTDLFQQVDQMMENLQ